MRDCRDVIMLAKPGYIYIVRNGGKKWRRKDRRREKWREAEGEMEGIQEAGEDRGGKQ